MGSSTAMRMRSAVRSELSDTSCMVERFCQTVLAAKSPPKTTTETAVISRRTRTPNDW